MTEDTGKYMLPNGSWINPELVKAQGIDDARLKRLIWLHFQKDEVMRKAHDAVREIENEMQEVWGFEPDESKHTHRFLIPYPEERFIPESPES